MERRLVWISVALAVALCGACDSGGSPSRQLDRPVWQLRDLPASQCPMGRAARRIAEVEGAGDGWEILSLGADGSLIYGRRDASGPGYHGRARYSAKLLGASSGSQPIAIGDEALIDAALSPAPGHAVAIVTAAGKLLLWRPDGESAVLDRAAKPGLSFSADGSKLAYAKGVAPELDVYIVDLPSRGGAAERTARQHSGSDRGAELRSARQITQHDGPDYLPALSRDGRRVLFVSSRRGLPSLWLTTSDGSEPRQVTPGAHDPARPAAARRVSSPDGRAAPLWGKGFIVFFDGKGVSAVSDSTGELLTHHTGARHPHWLRFGEEVAFEVGSGTFKAARLTKEIAAP